MKRGEGCRRPFLRSPLPPRMIDDTLPPQDVLRLYDRLGARYDWFAAMEGRAKTLALEVLELAPGLQVLDVGAGTGREHKLIQERIAPHGIALWSGPVAGHAQAVPPALRDAAVPGGRPPLTLPGAALRPPVRSLRAGPAAGKRPGCRAAGVPACAQTRRAPGSHLHDRGHDPAQPGDHGRLGGGLPAEPVHLRRLPPAAPERASRSSRAATSSATQWSPSSGCPARCSPPVERRSKAAGATERKRTWTSS